VVNNSGAALNADLWSPESFMRDFGHIRHSLINCLTGNTVPKAKLKEFWDGFQHVTKRLKDARGTPMLLKLKDWPPSDDIKNFMPDRCAAKSFCQMSLPVVAIRLSVFPGNSSSRKNGN
jgi:lysine-specific demethylase 3